MQLKNLQRTLNRHFSCKKSDSDGQQEDEEVLKYCNYQENAKSKPQRMWLLSKNKSKGTWKEKVNLHRWWKCKLSSHYRKQYGVSFENKN